jgi:MFS family permease
MIFFTISIPVEVVFARQTLHAGAGGYGLLLSAWGGGAIAGSVIYARWRSLSSRVLISLGAALVGAGFLPMAVAPDLSIAVVGAAIAGIGNGIEIVAMRTALQEAAPAQSMSLILGLNETLFQAMPGIGIVVGGVITTLAGPRAALGTGAAGALLIALTMRLALPLEDAERPGTAAAKQTETAEQRVGIAARRD